MLHEIEFNASITVDIEELLPLLKLPPGARLLNARIMGTEPGNLALSVEVEGTLSFTTDVGLLNETGGDGGLVLG